MRPRSIGRQTELSRQTPREGLPWVKIMEDPAELLP